MKHKLWKGLALLVAFALLAAGIPMLAQAASPISDVIDDPAFLEALDLLGFPGTMMDNDAFITGTTSLVLSGKGIRDLTGIEIFINLEELDVSDNLLDDTSDVPWTALDALVLTVFDCDDNYLSPGLVGDLTTSPYSFSAASFGTQKTFVPVTGFSGMPTVWMVGQPFNLSATPVLEPAGLSTAEAMGVDIEWSGTDVGGFWFNPTVAGTYVLTATVPFARSLDNDDNEYAYTIEVFEGPFVPVVDVLDSAMAALASPGIAPGDLPINLDAYVSGTDPVDATFQTIEWELVTDGGTGATIAGGSFVDAIQAGTATVRLRIKNGTDYNPQKDFTREYNIKVNYVPVTGIGSILPITAGKTYDLTELAKPYIVPTTAAVAADPHITWTATDFSAVGGLTNVYLSGSDLSVNTTGYLTLTASIADGVSIGTPFITTSIILTVTYTPTSWGGLLSETYIPGEELQLAAILTGSYDTVDTWEYSIDGGTTWVTTTTGIIPDTDTEDAGGDPIYVRAKVENGFAIGMPMVFDNDLNDGVGPGFPITNGFAAVDHIDIYSGPLQTNNGYDLNPTVYPPDASFQDIVWEKVSGPGTLTFSGNMVTADAPGLYEIKATIAKGLSSVPPVDYVDATFTIYVFNVPVTDISGYSTSCTTNNSLPLNAVAVPPTATKTTITDWICVSGPATISRPAPFSFLPTAAGTYGILIEVDGGLADPAATSPISGSWSWPASYPKAGAYYKYIEIVVTNRATDNVLASPSGLAPNTPTPITGIVMPNSGPAPASAKNSDVQLLLVGGDASIDTITPTPAGFSGFPGSGWVPNDGTLEVTATLLSGQSSGKIYVLARVENGLTNALESMGPITINSTSYTCPGDGCFYKLLEIPVSNQKVTSVTVELDPPVPAVQANQPRDIVGTVMPSNATAAEIIWFVREDDKQYWKDPLTGGTVLNPFYPGSSNKLPAGVTADDVTIDPNVKVDNVNTVPFTAPKAGTYWVQGVISGGCPGDNLASTNYLYPNNFVTEPFAITVVNVPVDSITIEFLDAFDNVLPDVYVGDTFYLKATLGGSPTDTTVEWRITNAGGTGVGPTAPAVYDTYDTASTGTLPSMAPTASGTITISATVPGGTVTGGPVSVSKTILVKNRPVIGLSGLPVEVYVGTPEEITCVLEPSTPIPTATTANITWGIAGVVYSDGTNLFPLDGTNARIQTVGGKPYVALDNRGDPLVTAGKEVYVLLKAVVAGGAEDGTSVTFTGDADALSGTTEEWLAIAVFNDEPEGVIIPGETVPNTGRFSVNANANLILSGVVSPYTATYKTIVWSLNTDSTPAGDADVIAGVFKASTPGTATVKATIVNGGKIGQDIEFNIDVDVHLVEVANITGIPANLQAGTYTLNGNVTPSNATYKTIVWSVEDAGTTGATISGNSLETLGAGTVVIRATISGVDEYGFAYVYEKDFTINVTIVGVTGIFLPNTVPPNADTTITAEVRPSSAHKQTITWEVLPETGFLEEGVDFDWTPDGIENKVIDVHTTVAGAIKVKATIVGGKSDGSVYEQEFIIYVCSIVMGIINVPETAVAGVPKQITGDIISDNTNLTIEWSMVDAGSTWATITSDGLFNATRSGTVLIKATVAGGNPATPGNPEGNYEYYFEINVTGSVGPGAGEASRIVVTGGTTINPRHTADISVRDAVGKTTYYSSDPKIATVDENGKILAKRPGTVTITAMTSDGYVETVTIKVKYSFWQWLLVIFLFGWCWVPLK